MDKNYSKVAFRIVINLIFYQSQRGSNGSELMSMVIAQNYFLSGSKK